MYYTELNTLLVSSNPNDMSDQDEKISDFSADNSCLTQTRFKKCSYLWAIENYISVHDKRGRIMKSLTFSASNDDFKWQLYLDPAYDSSRIALHLYPASENADFAEHSPITGTLKLGIINAENAESSIQTSEFILSMDTSDTFTGFNNFVLKSTLTNEANKLLPQDKLKIFCQVSYIKETDIVNISGEPYSNSLQLEPVCLGDFEALYLNEEFSDVKLLVNGKTYPAHKSIIVARSPVFKAMLSHDLKEKQSNCIEISDMNTPAFEEMMRYIYTGKVQNLEELAGELLAAADKFDLKNLKSIAEKQLYDEISLETVVKTLVLGDLYHAENLKKQALLFIKIHSYTSNILNSEVRASLISFPHILLEIIDTFGLPDSA